MVGIVVGIVVEVEVVVGVGIKECEMIVSWFSAGCSSALVTKLAIIKYGNIKIFYTDIEDQHSDTYRFIRDCEKWFGLPVEILTGRFKNVNDCCLSTAFIVSAYGASCSNRMKKEVRKNWERKNEGRHTYIWGYDCNERKRINSIVESMPNYDHEFPLLDRQLDKETIHGIVQEAGIKRPKMYDMGYSNNNCIGCIKGGMGYWNKIRELEGK